MPLGDNVWFAHFFDSLNSDSPVKTPTDAGGGDPTVSGGKATFASADSGDGQIFSGLTAFNPGLDGDWTVAVRAKITADTYNSNAMVHIGTSANWNNFPVFRQGGGDATGAVYAYNPGGQYANGTDGDINFTTTYTHVFRYDSSKTNYFSLYIDGVDKTATRSNDFNSPNGGESMTLSSATDVTIGSEYDGTRALDGEIEWVVIWDRAITDTELANNMNETDLKAAILSPAGVINNVSLADVLAINDGSPIQ